MSIYLIKYNVFKLKLKEKLRDQCIKCPTNSAKTGYQNVTLLVTKLAANTLYKH